MGKVTLTTHTTGTPKGKGDEIYLVGIHEKRWEVEQEKKCKAPVKTPITFHHVKTDGSKTSSSFLFGTEDYYENYYFLLKDCYGRLKDDYDNPSLELHVHLHLLNNDSEIGEEEDHWYIVPFIVVAGFLIVLQHAKNRDSPRDDWPKHLLFMGTATQISSLIWKSFGFLIYYFTGTDYFIFHLIYLLLHSTSESSIVGLLTLMAFGWTLTFQHDKQF